MYQKINNNNFIPTMRRSFHIDYIIFDIDGVLIDVKKSYNEAIKNTVQFIVRNLIKRNLKNLVTDKIILKFRQTGGFNNDADTSYAIILALLSHQDLENANLEKFLLEVAEHADETGIESVEKYIRKLRLNKISPSDYLINIDKILDYLNYPGKVGDSIVSTVFDEFFYGQELFLERYKIKSKYYFGKPLIENDRIVITDNTVRKLIERFNDKIAMLSGRSKIAAAYALDNKFYLLNEKNSVFLEDEDRKFSKPNPYGLKKIINTINTRNNILYCGDSVEDLIMARRAEEELNQKNPNKTKTNIFFCGIYGCSSNTDELISKFMEKKADIIIKSVNDLPYILNKVS
ncbi:MAG TPA: HAD family hydrolase [Nitrososphaeraceae archaeon]|jgi:phosphoglycolate phosphatase-like HAD superfamily hydrolase|nr:HAD family hydrolase [Nitrososphaeraceae archaeon]HSL14080.1 HAD family hydrolase [Nitrososphaeraceae archaeon]